MCGITGIYSLTGAVPRRAIDEFTDSLAHRGPDGRGVYINNNVALGHRRLAILDLSDAGACPMRYTTLDGRELYITFNGEVFNFLELRAELEGKGYRFRSSTDTEVIAAAYAEWGERCVYRFNGMWAFAIFDCRSRNLFLSRDRFGVKPLYLLQNSQRIAFASEIKAFLALDTTSLTFNSDVVTPVWERYRYDGKTPHTVAREITSLLAGHNALITPDGSVNITKWWNTRDHLPVVPERYEDQVALFRDLFLDAVRIRLRSDVPIATCLSGGIDSSAVATAISYLKNIKSESGDRSASSWQNSFVATFPGSFLDEERFAAEIIKATGATPHYLPITARSGLECVVDSVWSLDEPSGGLATSVWMLYRKLRQDKIVVSLDGHGGDELLGGYGWYMQQPIRELNSTLYSDFHENLLPTILRNYDRCSMAHGIEVRMPLMDYRLVSFAHALPATSKMGGGYLKRILRDATKDFMPQVINERHGKIGFNSPLIEWLNGDLAKLLERVFSHDSYLSLPFNDTRTIAAQILGKCRDKSWVKADWDLAYKVTVLLNLSLWRIMFEARDPQYISDWLPTLEEVTQVTVQGSGALGNVLRASKTEVVLQTSSSTLSPAVTETLTKLAEAQVNRPLECRVRFYGPMQEGMLGAIAKNWCGDASHYTVTTGSSTDRCEIGIVVDHTTPIPSGATELLARRGVAVNSNKPTTYFDSMDDLQEKLAKIVEREEQVVTEIREPQKARKEEEMNNPEQATDINKLVSDALKALQDKNLTQARIIIDEALSFNQQVRDLQFVRGLISLEQGRYDEARGALQAELDLDPTRADVRSVVDEILPLFR